MPDEAVVKEIKKEIKDGLAPMFEEAREKGLWFRSIYQDLWFSPDELEAAQSQGRFNWGADNWKLYDPRIRLEQLGRTVQSAAQAFSDFQVKLANL